MSKKISIIEIILNILMLLLSLLVIYWLVKLIIGGSPALSEFNFGLIILIITFLVKMYRELGEIKVGIKHSFNRIKYDMGLIKNKLKVK